YACQYGLRAHGRVNPGLIEKRAVGSFVVERQRLFQMRSGLQQAPDEHQGPTTRVVSENEPSRIVPLLTETQQILVHALRQVELTPDRAIDRLPTWDVEKLGGRA